MSVLTRRGRTVAGWALVLGLLGAWWLLSATAYWLTGVPG